MIYSWGELISLEYGKPVPDKNLSKGNVPVYGTNGRIGTSNFPPLCNHPSFILGRKGAYRGVHYSGCPFSVIDTAFYASSKTEKLDLKWAYYKFLTYDINRMDSGSAIPSTDRYEIYAISVDLPSLSEQRAVVSLLEKIDEKITVNTKINDYLEQMARAMYDDFAGSSDWTQSSISKIAEINASTYSAKENWAFVNYLDTSSITKGIISEIQHITSIEDLPIRARRKVAAGDVLFSTVRPNQCHYGLIGTPLDNMLVSTGFVVLHSTHTSVSNEFLYLLLSSKPIVAQLQAIGEQSVSAYPSIKPSDIAALDILIPNDGDNLNGMLRATFRQIANGNEENVRLASLRDTLLPRLMSGELSVADVQAAK